MLRPLSPAHSESSAPSAFGPGLLRRGVAVLSALFLVAGIALLGGTTAAAAAEPWMNTALSPDRRADLLADAMTLDQKLVLFTPDPQQAIPELGIPARREVDGGTGITTAPGANTTSFPAGLALASTWNADLARAFGRQGGLEARLTGYSGWAAPSADLLRNPFHGRQWSSYGEDPVLGGLLPASVVKGVNDNKGVYALPKHWLVNTQETQRRTLDNEVSERALRETYVRQWEPLLAQGPGAVMCAFPKLNGDFSCENEELLTGILKDDLGYRGWVSSDFNACYTFGAFTAGSDVCGPEFPSQAQLKQAVQDGTIPAARFADMVHRILRTYFARGLIDNPPPGSLVNPRPDAAPLPAAVVKQSRDVAYRIAVDGSVLLRNQDKALPLKAGSLDSIAVIGEGADRYISGFGADFVRRPTRTIPILDGIKSRAGSGVQINQADGTDPARVADLMPGQEPVPSSVLSPAAGDGNGLTAEWFASPNFTGTPLVTRTEDQVNWGQGLAGILGLFGAEPSPAPKLPQPFLGIPEPSIRWTGKLNPVASGSYQLGFTLLGEAKLWVDGNLILDRKTDTVTAVSVPISLQAGSSHDIRLDYVANASNQCCSGTQNIGPAIRLSWTPPKAVSSPQIDEAVRAARKSDVAVIVANDYLGESLDRGTMTLPQGQNRLIRAVAKANPNTIVVLTTGAAVKVPWLKDVAAVVESWYPGQEQGRAVAALLFGDENFSGRLPLTWPKTEGQVTGGLGIDNPYYDVNKPDITVSHDEGIYVGYRGYDRANLTPQFPFGYGLSYSGVRYRSLKVSNPRLARANRPSTATTGKVKVKVQNTGKTTITHTVQVYAGKLPTGTVTPERQLIGWSKVKLKKGQSRTVTISVKLEQPTHLLAYWNSRQNKWVTPTGKSTIYVGSSERSIGLTGKITVRGPR